MKFQLIHLEAEEDFHSLRDKLGWVRGGYVVLVWPERGRPLARELDLVLLQRYALQRSLSVGLLTFDPATRQLARQLGLPLLTSLDRLQPEDWYAEPARGPRPLLRRRASGTHRELAWARYLASQRAPLRLPRQALIGLAGVLALAAALYLIPAARITLFPLIGSRSFAFRMQFAFPGGAAQSVPLREMSVQVQGSLEAPVSGRAVLPTLPASGAAMLRNMGEQALWIPAGTVLRTEDGAQAFETRQSVQLPRGIGGQVRVEVVALAPGKAGNLAPGTRLTMDSPQGLLVEVWVPEGLAGGREMPVSAVRAADVAALRRELRRTLETRARFALQRALPEGWRLLDWTQTAAVEEESIKPQIGEPAGWVEGQMRLRMQGLAYEERALQEALRAAIERELPAGDEMLLDRLEYTVEPLGPPREGELPVRVVGGYAFLRKVEVEPLRQALRGRLMEDADRILKKAPGGWQAAPQIEPWPPWWPWMPWNARRITFQWQGVP